MLSIVAVIAGGLAILALPVAQYPEIAPPTVTVTTSYPGANALTVAAPGGMSIAGQAEQVINWNRASVKFTYYGSNIFSVAKSS